jgi:hypothetical protein
MSIERCTCDLNIMKLNKINCDIVLSPTKDSNLTETLLVDIVVLVVVV